MENPVTFYTILDKNGSLLLLNNSIIYSTDEQVLKDFIQDKGEVFISPISFKEIEESAKEVKVEIYEITPFGGTFKFQRLIIFGSDTIH